MCVSDRGVSEGQTGRGRAGRMPNAGRLVGVRRIRGGNEEGRMGGRRRGRSRRAYGVAVTFLPHKGGAVPESERRRAAWRITEPSHTCSYSSFAVPSPHLFPAWAGRRAGARGGVCVCVTATRDHWVCIITGNNEGAFKEKYFRALGRQFSPTITPPEIPPLPPSPPSLSSSLLSLPTH